LRTLSEFYLPVRYPDVSFRSFDKETAKEALNMAEIIVEKIREKF
jgi:HEPN domain-containing protein